MRNLKIWAIGAFLVLALLSSCARSPQARRDKYLADGKALLEKKDYTRAILNFRNAAQAMPNDAEAYYQLGLAALQLGDVRTGALSVKKAVELNPKHTAANLKLAELMAHGDAELIRQAETRLKELRQTTPVTPEMLNALAYTELQLGKATDAVQTLENFLVTNPGELTSAVLMAQAKLAKSDLKGAEEVLLKASAASPKEPQPHVMLGEFYRATNRPGDAEAQLQTALRLDPNNVQALYSLAVAQYGAGRMPDAEATFKRLAVLSDSPYPHIYALFLLRQGRRDEAVHEFERLAKQDPNDRMARGRLISAYQLVGRTADATKIIEEALQKNPKDIDALVRRAQLAVVGGKYEAAEKDLTQVLRLQPDSAPTHYFMAKLHQGRGQELSARQELSKAVQLDSSLLIARLDLAQSLITSKDPKGALDVLDAAPGPEKSVPEVIVQRNWALWATNDMVEMRKGIDAGLALQRSTDLLLQDGIWKLRSGNSSGGRAALEEALKIDPADVRALSVLKESYEMQKQTAVALDKVKEYAAREPRSAPVQNFLGAIMLARGDNAGARNAFQLAKAADASSVEADVGLVRLDLTEGKLADAQNRLQAVVSASPGNTAAHLWLGDVDLMRADFGRAEKQFRMVLTAEPDNPQALNNLAFLMAENGGQPAEALKYAQKAKELAPDKPEYSDTLGWILYKQGLYPSAVQELERATAQRSKPIWEYHLAMAYAKAGDSQHARSILDRALKQDPKLPEAKLAQQVVGSVASNSANGR
jgi:tetratricopeptide (TPR) repeat protein